MSNMSGFGAQSVQRRSMGEIRVGWEFIFVFGSRASRRDLLLGDQPNAASSWIWGVVMQAVGIHANAPTCVSPSADLVHEHSTPKH
nr:hypothetical protein CFP56_53751 [Quercus suber]